VRIAQLPWYDLKSQREANDAWWRGIAGHLRALGVDDVPDELLRDGRFADNWRRADLLLSQACGYDVLYDASDAIVPIATPCYGAEGCEGARYRSFIVVRADRAWQTVEQLRGLRVAINQVSSHSGNNAMRPHIADLHEQGSFFGGVVETGSHVDSLRAVHEGRVEVACIDVVVLALLRRCASPLVRGLRKITCTRAALSPPYVTSVRTAPALRDVLREALRRAVTDPSLQAARDELLLRDFAFYPPESYAELEDFEAPALATGYRELPAPRRSPLG